MCTHPARSHGCAERFLIALRRPRDASRDPGVASWHFTPAVPRNRNPGHGPKGRRSGTHSPRSGVKIASRIRLLQQVGVRVDPGSPLALRPGIRSEIFCNPATSGRMRGEMCTHPARSHGCAERFLIALRHPRDASRDPAVASWHFTSAIPPKPQSRTRPEGPPIRDPIAPRRRQDCEQNQSIAASGNESRPRLSAGAPAGDPMRDLFPFRGIWVDPMRDRSSCCGI